MSTRQEVYKLLAINKSKKEIATSLSVSVRTIERYAKEYSDTLATNDKKTTTTAEKKLRKEIAKAHIVTGSSIKEASEASGISFSAALKMSCKDNLQQKQADFLRQLREEHKEKILQNKRDRFEINTRIKADLSVAESSKLTQEMLLMNERTEQEILESDRLIQLEKLEFEREKALSDAEKTNEKLDDVLNKLEESL
ncbi:hypothetical protein A2U04_05270 [Fusobacterium necrophorum subsp. funduliforme]|uniref:hypothetical protein n=1 Tax=Fusobacterium necrophorum TaxID=859 RepID=UPI000787EE58|nr:hypothetical protein [Fusobacterium necrophorum]KYM48137.1 hypothetical protein A2U04_05270 [Fusobacterium necrophorum subsp. funduliforme]